MSPCMFLEATKHQAVLMTCDHCKEFGCANIAELNDHIVSAHPDVAPEICDDCGTVLGTRHAIKYQ